MKKRFRLIALQVILAALAALAVHRMNWAPPAITSEATAEEKGATAGPASVEGTMPVEGDMHEFMEYVFEPPYKRLKATLAGEALDKAAFKTVKSDGLILAEGGNLLLMRLPEKEADAWSAMAIAVRSAGTELYQAGKAKDTEASRKTFAALLLNCNKCHDKFAHGEHQLSP